MMKLVDTHTHIYLPEFDGILPDLISESLSAGVTQMYLPNIDSSTTEAMLKLADQYPDSCRPMMGLHPCSVKPESYKQELSAVERTLAERKFWGIGEIGLDLYWDKSTFEIQKEAFVTQCNWAIELNLPVSVHTREATAEGIELVKPLAQKGLKGVFHCFGGTRTQAEEIIGMGMYLGIGGVISFKNSGLKETLKGISLSNIVLETDAPYLAPVPYRGKLNKPSYIPLIAAQLAELMQCGIDEVAYLTTQNAELIFGS